MIALHAVDPPDWLPAGVTVQLPKPEILALGRTRESLQYLASEDPKLVAIERFCATGIITPLARTGRDSALPRDRGTVADAILEGREGPEGPALDVTADVEAVHATYAAPDRVQVDIATFVVYRDEIGLRITFKGNGREFSTGEIDWRQLTEAASRSEGALTA